LKGTLPWASVTQCGKWLYYVTAIVVKLYGGILSAHELHHIEKATVQFKIPFTQN